jgi:hypothetical protein
MLNLWLAWTTTLTNNEYWNITKDQQKFSIIIYITTIRLLFHLDDGKGDSDVYTAVKGHAS